MNDEWQTPRWLFDALFEEFLFTVDAAASAQNAQLPRYWTAEDDALTLPWQGQRVFLNPPYSRGQLPKWLAKIEHETRGKKWPYCADLVVAVLPADTSTRYFHEYVMKADEIRLMEGRVKFVGDPDDPLPGSPKFGTIIAIWQGGLSLLPSPRIVSWKAPKATPSTPVSLAAGATSPNGQGPTLTIASGSTLPSTV